MVLFSYVQKKKVELKLLEDQKVILIFDAFKGQITNKVTKFIEENICVIVHTPNNKTDQLQPEFLKGKFECWYDQQITNHLEGGSSVYDIHVALKLSVIKPIHAKWLLGLYDHLRDSSDTNIK